MRTVKLLLTGAMLALSALGQRAMAALDATWTEVTSLPTTTADMANNYYVFVEQNSGNGLMLQLATGNYQQSSYMGLYFKTALDDPTSDPTYMFTLETTDGTNFGVRNVQYNTNMLQTEYNKAFNLHTHDQPSLCDWSKWIFAYVSDGGYWTIQNYKYPAQGYWGPWNTNSFTDGSELAANKTDEASIGHFKIYAKTVSAVAMAQAEYEVALANAKDVDQSADMNKDVLTALQSAISTYGNVESTAADDYTTATTALTTATSDATASIKAYSNAATILPKMEAWLQTFNFYSASALNTYYTANKQKYDDKTLTTDEANALTDPTATTKYNKQPALLSSFLRSAWSGSYVLNTWSTEGTTDGSGVVVPFFQSFKGTDGASTLGEQTITGTLTDLEEGTYAVSILVRLAANDVKAVGATMQVNDGTAVDLTDGTAGSDIENTHTTYGTFTAIGTVGSDGKLEVKLSIAADNNIGWLAFKDATYKKIEADDLYTRTKTSSGWGTVCLPKAATPAGDTRAYTIAGINSEKTQLTLAKATTMTAGVPYIYCNATADATFVMDGETATAPVAGANNLTGVFASALGSVADGSYILYSGAWRKVDNASEFNLGDNRAYISSLEGIEVTDASDAKTMTVVFDDTTTGINSVETVATEDNSSICNLAGQRVNKSYKGIVVKNGRKYISK
jgi:hypothetical protein